MLPCVLEAPDVLPMVCIGALLSFMCGVGIGANDLSANFAMVVGSGSLSMKKSVILCATFELLGAAFMGARVSDTIRNGIAMPELFEGDPGLVIVGMVCAAFAASMWLFLSTYYGLPVSITHTVVGSVLGFAIFARGFTFEHVRTSGIVKIVLSWIVAPVGAAIVTAALFHLLRTQIMRKAHAQRIAFGALPYCMALSLMVNVVFIFIEQPPVLAPINNAVSFPMQVLVACSTVALACYWASQNIFPEVMKRANAATEFLWEAPSLVTASPAMGPSSAPSGALETNASFGGIPESSATMNKAGSMVRLSSMAMTDSAVLPAAESDDVSVEPTAALPKHKPQRPAHGMRKRAPSGGYKHIDVEMSTDAASDEGEEDSDSESTTQPAGASVQFFNPRAEYLFTALQVFAGAMSSFVHGAVAGANATAPFLTVYDVFTKDYMKRNRSDTGWIMIVAMAGIALGMYSLGSRLVKTVGVELVTVTPVRGFAMQVGGTIVTMLCTGLGIPVSLTQCQVGAAIGCGITDADGDTSLVKWSTVFKIVGGWVVTIIIGALTCGLSMHLVSYFYCLESHHLKVK